MPAMTPLLEANGRVATITLRRPKIANRLGPEDLDVLADHVAAVNADLNVLVLRVRGEGRYFCSGFDIKQLGGPDVEASGDGASRFGAVVDLVEQARPVTIAVIHGGVYGGATDLALACDFRVGGSHAEMFMPAARLGLHFYRGGLERYVSRLGLDVAKRLFLTGEKLDAAAMTQCGFLTHRAATDEVDATVEGLCRTLVGMAPIALLGMKKHLNRIALGRLDCDDLQRDVMRAAKSEDLREGAAAWAAKRAPAFTGR